VFAFLDNTFFKSIHNQLLFLVDVFIAMVETHHLAVEQGIYSMRGLSLEVPYICSRVKESCPTKQEFNLTEADVWEVQKFKDIINAPRSRKLANVDHTVITKAAAATEVIYTAIKISIKGERGGEPLRTLLSKSFFEQWLTRDIVKLGY